MAKSENIPMLAQRVTIKPIQGIGTYVGVLFTVYTLNTEPIPIAKDGYYISLHFKEEEKEISLINFIEADAIVSNQPAQIIYYPKNIFVKEELPIKDVRSIIYYYPKE